MMSRYSFIRTKSVLDGGDAGTIALPLPRRPSGVPAAGPGGQRQQDAGQSRIGAHRRHERAVGNDNLFRTHGDGEGDIQRVVGAVVDGEADLQCDVV